MASSMGWCKKRWHRGRCKCDKNRQCQRIDCWREKVCLLWCFFLVFSATGQWSPCSILCKPLCNPLSLSLSLSPSLSQTHTHTHTHKFCSSITEPAICMCICVFGVSLPFAKRAWRIDWFYSQFYGCLLICSSWASNPQSQLHMNMFGDLWSLCLSVYRCQQGNEISFAEITDFSLLCVCVCSFLGRYASIQAIESPSKEDEQQWLTYWVLYSFITLFEVAAAPVLFWYTTYPQKLPPSSSEALQWDPDPGFQMQTFIKEKQPLGWAHEHFIWRTMRSLHLSSLDWLVSHITWFLGKDSAEISVDYFL